MHRRMSLFGAFYNQGAACSSNSRLLVEKSVADDFVAELVKRTANMKPGNPRDPDSAQGAIVDEAHTAQVLGFVERAGRDANIRVGGRRETVNGRGCFVEPTVATGLPPTAELVT